MAVIEILDDCPTTYGRRNKFRSVVDMMKRFKEQAVPVAKAEKMSKEELDSKIVTGILHREERPEYCEQYAQVVKTARSL
jgi:2-oxoglutarate ferredoxin oxidoreductase subunit beta